MLVALGTTAGILIFPEVRWALWGCLLFVGVPATLKGLRRGLRVTPGQRALLTVLFLAQLISFGVAWAQGQRGLVRLEAGQLMLAYVVAGIVLADRDQTLN